MISALQNHIRHHGKFLLIVMVGILAVSMLFWGQWRSVDVTQDQKIRIYGRPISRIELDHAKDAFAFNLTLKTGRLIHRNDIDSEEGVSQLLMSMALAEKARRMGIRVTDEEIAQSIRSMPVFQNNGQFSQELFAKIISSELTKRRLTEKDLQDIVSAQIAIARLNQLVLATALTASDEADDYLRLLNEKIQMDVAKYDPKNFKPTVVPADKELQAFYQSNAEPFRVGTQVRALYVEFPILDESKGNTVSDDQLREMYEKNFSQFVGKDGKVKSFDEVKPLLKKAVLQQTAVDQAGRRATDFSLKFVTESKEKPDFRAMAAKENLKVGDTGLIGEVSQLKGISAPDPFFQEMMKLSKDNPVSLPIVGVNGIYVAYWQDGKESYQPELKDVRNRVLELWKEEQSLKMAREKGLEARIKLNQLLGQNKSFDEATKIAGIKWDELPPFTIRDIKKDDLNRFYEQAAFGVPAGTVGDFQEDPRGGFFVYVKSRQPADPKQIESQRMEINAVLERKAQNLAMLEFRKKVVEESGLMPLFESLSKKAARK